jgi:hypothetical protein
MHSEGANSKFPDFSRFVSQISPERKEIEIRSLRH